MQKNRFLTFLFSFIPGCGLMYLGYMKKGLQVMSMTAAAGFLGFFFSSLRFGWFEGLFFLLIPIIWFYQMFDSMHTVSRMRNQGIELPADDGFVLPDKMIKFSPMQNRTVAKIIAYILITVGSISLVLGVLDNMWRFPIDGEILYIINHAIRGSLIPAIISILLIIAGFKLLKGGKAKRSGGDFDKDGDLP
jgi:hypothetical protein